MDTNFRYSWTWASPATTKLQNLSMNVLAFQTRRTEIELTETHDGCLKSLNASEYEYLARSFLLQYATPEEEEICNVHVKNIDGYADFYHECCYKNKDNEMKCFNILKSSWMQAIEVCTYIVIVFFILYCPYLIPTSFYRKKYAPFSFEHHPDKPISITVKKTTDTGRWWQNRHIQHIIPFSNFFRMESFIKVLGGMKNETVYELQVSKLSLKVPHDDMVSENKTPTGLFKTLYEYFVQCRIRDKNNKNDCCNTNLFGCCRRFGKEYPWYKGLRLLMRIVLCLVVCSPWIVRLCVYYLYEKDIRLERKRAADIRNLELQLDINLTYYLTPIHEVFIICYSIIAVDYILLGFVSKRMKLLFQIMMQTCLQDMRDSPKNYVINWAFRVLTTPLRKFGIFGFFIGLLFWIFAVPVVFIVLSYRIFPTVNLSLSLIMKYLCFIFSRTTGSSKLSKWKDSVCKNLDLQMDDGKNKKDHRKFNVRNPVLRLILIMLAFLTVISFVLFSVECIIFVIEVAVYTLIGLIVNSSHAMQYISALSIGWLYFNSCFSGIDNLFLKYNKALHGILQEDNKDEITKVAQLPSEIQNNTAFKVKHSNDDDPCMIHSYGRPRWSTKGVVLLLDKYDKPYITKQFFFDACQIEHPHCPGKLSTHLILAFKRFICLVLFLMFVIMVVLAFGDAYNISITNQLLATVAGGFVPWILMKSDILFPKPEEPNLDQLKSNLIFMTSLNETIFDDEEEWTIQDIIVDSVQMVEATENCHNSVNSEAKQTGNVKEKHTIKENGRSDGEEISEELLPKTKTFIQRQIDLIIEMPPNVNLNFVEMI